ncbi:hypothetical protein [Paraburkholderia hayleyella]|uniref:hypothetical protein n=1 Tax=Paraburkholderia hayleyella TaxID=2152889 RepID=UPI001290FDE1|nr:hypothetical protein [Paraburkholderia hayleyella]
MFSPRINPNSPRRKVSFSLTSSDINSNQSSKFDFDNKLDNQIHHHPQITATTPLNSSNVSCEIPEYNVATSFTTLPPDFPTAFNQFIFPSLDLSINEIDTEILENSIPYLETSFIEYFGLDKNNPEAGNLKFGAPLFSELSEADHHLLEASTKLYRHFLAGKNQIENILHEHEIDFIESIEPLPSLAQIEGGLKAAKALIDHINFEYNTYYYLYLSSEPIQPSNISENTIPNSDVFFKYRKSGDEATALYDLKNNMVRERSITKALSKIKKLKIHSGSFKVALKKELHKYLKIPKKNRNPDVIKFSQLIILGCVVTHQNYLKYSTEYSKRIEFIKLSLELS